QDEIAVELGYASHADYLSKEVKPAKLFGLTVENGLRDDFYKKLQQGEKEAAKLIHPDGSPVSASQWGIKGIRGQMKRTGRSWHPWGAAIDIDYSLNPYIMHESGETAMDALVAPIYRRIALFILKRDSVIPKSGTKDAIRDISETFKDESKKDRVSRLYDSLSEESDAMEKYFKIMLDTTLLQKEIDKHKPFGAAFWQDTWGVKDQTPSLDRVQEIMMLDYVALSGKTGPAISGKTYPDPKKVFKDISGDAPFVGRKPEDGFLAIRKEIVTAFTNAGLRWGAIDFGNPSGDVMHFDDGWGGFAKKKVAAEDKLAPKPKTKGLSYDAWDEQFDYSEPFDKTYTAADAKWAADKISPDYRHLGEALSSAPFDFTAATCAALCEANNFNVKSNPKDPRDEIIFALRGCCLSGGKESSGGLVSTVKLIEAVPDHQASRCVIGVWKRSTNQVAAFLGSTVPFWEGMKKQAGRPNEDLCNLMPTGRYKFTVGTHRPKEPEFIIPGALRQQTDVAMLRTFDDLIYEVTDTWDFGSPFDNIHPSRHPNPSDPFSSEGCMTIPGGGKFMTRTKKHDRLWSEFRKAAGLTAADAPENEDGFQFVVILLTGREARLINNSTKKSLTRLRFGSEGVDVRTLQLELSLLDRKAPGKGKYYAGKQDGGMGMTTAKAYIDWQKDQDGTADGIVTPAIAKSLGFDIINHVCLKDPVPLPKQLDAVTPIKLTDDIIKEYKKINDTQKWKKKGKLPEKRTFNEDIVWELPEKGDGYIIYNRNDQLDKPADYNDPKGLDEIGTKATIEKVIAIAKEWNKLHSDQPLQFGDISRPGGIDTPDHSGHMKGTEVDMRPLRKKNGTGGFKYTDTSIYSVDLTKEFIRCVRLLYPSTTFYFNDKAIYDDKDFKAFVSEEPDHDNHLHLMF
ncbi:MAG: peptidoglycan-binding protein, partial [Saprospiraceae bacterium]|nr:peptidoglycan-binding protein [Pyrinomonadaceae bacterium]